jgi:hypothetical protein
VWGVGVGGVVVVVVMVVVVVVCVCVCVGVGMGMSGWTWVNKQIVGQLVTRDMTHLLPFNNRPKKPRFVN